jgi:hypothetical protein
MRLMSHQYKLFHRAGLYAGISLLRSISADRAIAAPGALVFQVACSWILNRIMRNHLEHLKLKHLAYLYSQNKGFDWGHNESNDGAVAPTEQKTDPPNDEQEEERNYPEALLEPFWLLVVPPDAAASCQEVIMLVEDVLTLPPLLLSHSGVL